METVSEIIYFCLNFSWGKKDESTWENDRNNIQFNCLDGELDQMNFKCKIRLTELYINNYGGKILYTLNTID